MYLEAITTLSRKLKRAPSIMEIAKSVRRSHNAAWQACRRLEKLGYLARDEDGHYHLQRKT
jgi:hypothetical protein